jgi:hypothetical protein
MSLELKIELAAIVLILLVCMIKVINKNTLKLNYSLVWLFSLFAMAFALLFPSTVDKMANLLGIKYTSNLLFFIGFILLFLISLSLTLIVSKQSARIKKIIQLTSIATYVKDHKERKNQL